MKDIQIYYLPKPGGAINSIMPRGYQGGDVLEFIETLPRQFKWLCAYVDDVRVWTNSAARAEALREVAIGRQPDPGPRDLEEIGADPIE